MEEEQKNPQGLVDALRKTEDLGSDIVPEAPRGGLQVEISRCCKVPIRYTTGGIKMPYCPECKQTCHPTIYR